MGAILRGLVLVILVGTVGCTTRSESAKVERLPPWAPDWQKEGLTTEQRDASARQTLETSEKWLEPSCRWLEYGTWIQAWPQERALYQAAADAGYIELREVGQINRIGTPEPAYEVKLTELGRTETADCKADTQGRKVWGVPVSRRKLVSFAYDKEGASYSGATYFAVENEWQPTVVGERVKDVLTEHMKVQYGTWRTIVQMRRSQNRWHVVDLGEVGYYHPQPKW